MALRRTWTAGVCLILAATGCRTPQVEDLPPTPARERPAPTARRGGEPPAPPAHSAALHAPDLQTAAALAAARLAPALPAGTTWVAPVLPSPVPEALEAWWGRLHRFGRWLSREAERQAARGARAPLEAALRAGPVPWDGEAYPDGRAALAALAADWRRLRHNAGAVLEETRAAVAAALRARGVPLLEAGDAEAEVLFLACRAADSYDGEASLVPLFCRWLQTRKATAAVVLTLRRERTLAAAVREFASGKVRARVTVRLAAGPARGQPVP